MHSLLFCSNTYAVMQPQLANIRSRGITIIKNGYYPANDSNLANNVAWMDACHAAGLKVMIHLCTWTSAQPTLAAANAITFLNQAMTGAALSDYAADGTLLKDHPSVYGYYTDDESKGDDYSIAQREAVYDALKAVSDRPIMELHYVIPKRPDSTANHYPTDGTITHDLYAMDNYRYLNFASDASWQSYFDGEYAKLTTVDKANLCHVLQIMGHDIATTPPQNSVDDVQYYRMSTPNNWFTWGVGYYTWDKFNEPSWVYCTDDGYTYIQQDIEDANTDYLPSPAVAVTSLTYADGTFTLTGTCAAGCNVTYGGVPATVDEAGTSWSIALDPADPIVVGGGNGLSSVSTVTVIPTFNNSGDTGINIKKSDGTTPVVVYK